MEGDELAIEERKEITFSHNYWKAECKFGNKRIWQAMSMAYKKYKIIYRKVRTIFNAVYQEEEYKYLINTRVHQQKIPTSRDQLPNKTP